MVRCIASTRFTGGCSPPYSSQSPYSTLLQRFAAVVVQLRRQAPRHSFPCGCVCCAEGGARRRVWTAVVPATTRVFTSNHCEGVPVDGVHPMPADFFRHKPQNRPQRRRRTTRGPSRTPPLPLLPAVSPPRFAPNFPIFSRFQRRRRRAGWCVTVWGDAAANSDVETAAPLQTLVSAAAAAALATALRFRAVFSDVGWVV